METGGLKCQKYIAFCLQVLYADANIVYTA